MRDGPFMVLTRHFFTSMFDFGFLSDEGAESFKRVLMGTAAVALGLGFLLVRVFMGKYAGLSTGPPDAYQLALAADHAFLFAVPMWVVATAVVLTGHSLFPDENDYRILMAEPVSRNVIFRAKLSALLLFTALFVVGTHLALFPVFVLTIIGQPTAGALVSFTAAFGTSSAAASLCSALLVVAIHGVLILFAPRSRILAIEAITRGVLVAALVLSLPLLLRLPGAASAFASNAWWLHWAPPAWFVGLERWLQGDNRWTLLAVQAIIATTGALTASVVSYVMVYRRFGRLALRRSASHVAIVPARWRARRHAGRDVSIAIRQFIWITVRRSLLHQGIIVAILASAAALVVNGALASGLSRAGAGEPWTATLPWITVWAPMTLIFIAVPAVRVGLSVPTDLRANWIFRTTDDDETRGDAIAAGIRTVFVLGVVLPIAIAAPVQWWSLGTRTVLLILVEGLVGWLLVESIMRDWRQIPFTCTYLPGKGFVPHMFVKGIAAYIFFMTGAGAVLQGATTSVVTTGIAVLILGSLAVMLSIGRRWRAESTPLIFEDEPPSDIIPFRLNGD